MLTIEEKNEIKKNFDAGTPLREDLRRKVIKAIDKGNKYLLGDDSICCAWQDTVGPIQYSKTDSNTCAQVLFGRVVSDDHCQ